MGFQTPNNNAGLGLAPSNPGGDTLAPTTSSGSTPTSTAVQSTNIIIGVSAQVFRCTGTGLKPNTLHKAYLVGQDVSVNCAQIVTSGTTTTQYTYGSPLITDASGQIVFDYAFTPLNAPFPTHFISSANITVSIIPVGKQTFKLTSVDGSSYATSYIESKQTTG